ncbi:VOC family protein [Vulgatibacter sp.]|uniref:VOC family protein n=1 Tax=Vulgatibacter sp. TaxID=1971226 RepID=UPI0035690CF2
MNERIEAPQLAGITLAQIRVARPTDRLEEVVAFYRDGLGLQEIGRFTGHEGYDGVMLGLPGRTYHLEFTQHEGGSPGPAPSRDNLLVFYVPDEGGFDRLVERLRSRGHEPVEPENPYWKDKSLTFEDPDGWRLVICRTAGI